VARSIPACHASALRASTRVEHQSIQPAHRAPIRQRWTEEAPLYNMSILFQRLFIVAGVSGRSCWSLRVHVLSGAFIENDVSEPQYFLIQSRAS
jgi:hypothetical protein